MNILCRFIEKSILDTVKLSNRTIDTPFSLDIMSVTRTGSTYTASFTQGLMLNNYGSTVPEAWLAPLQYIKLGRLASDTDEKAHVKLIVPHSQGTTSNAKANVRPYYYIIGLCSRAQNENKQLPQTVGWEDYNNRGTMGTFDPLAE